MHRKFGKKRGPRRSFVRILAHNVIMKEHAQTTEARGKEIRSVIEKMVTTAKKQNLASFRRLLSQLPKDAASKLYYELAPRYKDRHGGYMRVTKLAERRKRDAAEQVIIEFV
ncbi:MAG: 50S ribosomal protein L17 [bacterium]|nr:50S ribosomal protein L17 [bacterium]